MIATRQRQRRRRRTVRRRSPHRLRRLVTAALLLAIVALGFTLLHSGSSSNTTSGIPVGNAAEAAPNGPPAPPETLATVSSLALELPVSQGRVTAIVYHATGVSDAIPLTPAGSQRNAGFLARLGDRLFGSGGSSGPRYYIDSGGTGSETSTVDVGAPAGTNVYSPVDGVVVSVQPYVLNGKVRGSIVQIRPSDLAAVIVTVGNLAKHLSVDVGTPVQASVTKLGTVVDLSKLIDQTVSHYTSDSGNHVSLQVGPAPGASPLL
ncbi:MAG TPA: hypothetical protein VHL51_15660 [Gaiellales bacterium]|nr:hypothetical protein [Gaiellales bacterium]